jgi:hypothetical protein
MSGNFKVEIEGLDVFKKQLSASEALKRVVPDMTLAVLSLHNTLEKRVGELFNTPATLSSVMIGKSVQPSELGNTFIRYSLQYRNKPITLENYNWTETANNTSLSTAPLRFDRPLGLVDWTEGTWSKDIKVEVRKGRKVLASRRGKDNLKGFIQGGKIKARLQKATYKVGEYPTKGKIGVRAPYSTLFGPSLATLASKVFSVDKEVEKAVDNMQDKIVKAFVGFYK